MTEYIERGEAENRLFQRAEIANSAYIDQTPYQIMMLAQNVVHLVPAADVRPVVLCRDCEYWQSDCGWCGYFDIGMNIDDFCSRGNKEEN